MIYQVLNDVTCKIFFHVNKLWGLSESCFGAMFEWIEFLKLLMYVNTTTLKKQNFLQISPLPWPLQQIQNICR